MASPTEPQLLSIMKSRLGIKETPGNKGDNPVILGWFKAVGHPEIEHDETSWCAVTVGSALIECGLPIPARNVNMMARSYATYGVPTEPKPGAIAIWPRGASWQGHVNVVERVNDDGTIVCIGGNQSNRNGGDAVTRTKPMDPSKAIAFRWPVAATVPALRKAGSTEIAKGDRIQNMGIFATFIAPIIAAVKDWFGGVSIPHFQTLPEGMTFWQQTLEGANAVARVAGDNPWIAGTIASGVVMAWVGHTIKAARVAKAEAGIPLSSEVASLAAKDAEPGDALVGA